MAEPKRLDIDSSHLTWLARALDIYMLSERVKPEELIGKIESLQRFSYPEGAVILSEGEAGSDLYVLFSGEAIVLKGGVELARLVPGDLFGEIAFLVGVPRTATVRAGANCEVFRCAARAFEDILAEHPNLIDSMRTIAKLRMEKLSPRGPAR